jgi:CDGSH-type Zn-finger protein
MGTIIFMNRRMQKKPKNARFIPLQDGPFLYENETDPEGAVIYDSDGNRIACGKRACLCRCGASEKKPFCDGTHARIGFSGRKESDSSRDRCVDYTAGRIIIHDNRSICSHAGYCWKNLPSVFKANSKPWIDARGAEAEEIMAVIDKCPSGALGYSIEGRKQEYPNRKPGVTVEDNGPYNLVGYIELVGCEPWPEGVSREHYCCCRCGRSKNKPFCDGSHDI